jgi:hypothetical protein
MNSRTDVVGLGVPPRGRVTMIVTTTQLLPNPQLLVAPIVEIPDGLPEQVTTLIKLGYVAFHEPLVLGHVVEP